MLTSVQRLAVVAIVTIGLTRLLTAQEKETPLPPPDRAPHLTLASPGPHAPVTALAFAPDASVLYVGGFDKQVRRYKLDKDGYTAIEPLRVPIGPNTAGVLNALAVSPDGKWLAAAGRAPMRGEAWAGADDGIGGNPLRLLPEVRRDFGVVYLFDPDNPNGGKVIRGAESEVRSLAFANPAPATGPVLVTTGLERNEKGDYSGTVRVFDATTGKQLAARSDLPATAFPAPSIAAWATGAGKKGLRVAVNWSTGDAEPGKLLVWDDPGTPNEKVAWPKEGAFNMALAVRVKDGAAAELITGGFNRAKGAGELLVRAADRDEPKAVPLAVPKGQLLLPVAVAALDAKGTAATAVLARIRGGEAGAVTWKHELRLVGTGAPSVELAGIVNSRPSPLASSADGRYVAVAGFGDNRVEVYSTAALVVGKGAEPQKLTGTQTGYTKVAFLAGEKVWAGGPDDAPDKGGVILNLDGKVRAAAPPGPKDAPKVDAPAAGSAPTILAPDAAKKLPARVAVTIGGQEKIASLKIGERATVAALLPGKPAWDANLGPVLAVAHTDQNSQSVLVTLFDATTGKPLFYLDGPTLPIKALAFSGTRALLAAAGDDGTITVWSLKTITRQWPAIEGLTVADREGKVVVTNVRPDGGAVGKLKVDDVIESVADAKGVQKPVKTALDFVSAVRGLKVGDNAQIKLQGKAAAVAVPIGARTGFRRPLFTLWVDPVAKGGKHAWVGWTPSGPYDSSGEDAESRIGWVTATGDPARPVAFAGANQYRKMFYKLDLIRRLMLTADYTDALASYPPPRNPDLVPQIATAILRDGRTVVREKLDALAVELDDPDEVLDRDRLELRWHVTGPGGTSEVTRESFGAGRMELDLSKHDWKRGEHRVHMKLFRTGPDVPGGVLVKEVTTTIAFVPPAPVLAVKIDGQEPKAGVEIETRNDEIELSATAQTKGNPDGAAVSVSWTGGEKPVELTAAAGGAFTPKKLKVKPEGTTVFLVTATNRGAGDMAEAESHAIEVRVRKLKPEVVNPPAVQLSVVTEHDLRTGAGAPYVISAPSVVLTAAVRDKNEIAVFEWKVGNDDWKPGKLDPKTGTETRTIPLPPGGESLSVQVRAKSAKSEFASDAATVRYDGLPEVKVKLPDAVVTAPDLTLAGALKVAGKRPFKVRLVVTSSRTGRVREFEPLIDAAQTAWKANVTLFPGENQLSYVVRYDNDRKELPSAEKINVQHLRPPVVIGGAPVEVGTGTVGNVSVAVVAPSDAAPEELLVNGGRVGFQKQTQPLRAFGAALWLLEARGASVNAGADRLKPVPIVVRNPEADSAAIAIEVRGQPEKAAVPPTIRLARNGTSLSPDQGLPPVGDPTFTFELKVTSETKLTRVEVWHGPSSTELQPAAAVQVAGAVAGAGGEVVLTAQPSVPLRRGADNHIRVVASNEGGTTTVAFNVSYAPPPVRVVIDAIEEPNGKVIKVQPGAAIPATSAVVKIRGRVLWDFDNEPIGKDAHLSAVFVANGVSHLPVRVDPAKGEKERAFSGDVFLNTLDPNPKVAGETRIRIELRSSERPIPVPQVGLQQATISVASQNPLRKQRLHVLVVGVDIPATERKALVQRVVGAVGGKIPGNNPNFTYGQFERKDFEFAYLYPPRLEYANERDLNALLGAARREIELRVKRSDEPWVNDLIVVYYQGEDWVDASTGRWMLHSATTMSGAGGKNPSRYAIRLDNLPQTPGMPVAVVNVASTATPDCNMCLDLPYMRCAWADAGSSGQLLDQIGKAVLSVRTFGGIADYVNTNVAKLANLAISLPKEGVGSRVVGLP